MIEVSDVIKERIKLAEADIATILERCDLKLAYREVKVNGHVVSGEIFLVPSEEEACPSK